MNTPAQEREAFEKADIEIPALGKHLAALLESATVEQCADFWAFTSGLQWHAWHARATQEAPAAAAVEALPEQTIKDIANGLNGVQPMLGQWQRDLRLARAVEAALKGAAAPAEQTADAIDARRYRWLRDIPRPQILEDAAPAAAPSKDTP